MERIALSVIPAADANTLLYRPISAGGSYASSRSCHGADADTLTRRIEQKHAGSSALLADNAGPSESRKHTGNTKTAKKQPSVVQQAHVPSDAGLSQHKSSMFNYSTDGQPVQQLTGAASGQQSDAADADQARPWPALSQSQYAAASHQSRLSAELPLVDRQSPLAQLPPMRHSQQPSLQNAAGVHTHSQPGQPHVRSFQVPAPHSMHASARSSANSDGQQRQIKPTSKPSLQHGASVAAWPRVDGVDTFLTEEVDPFNFRVASSGGWRMPESKRQVSVNALSRTSFGT